MLCSEHLRKQSLCLHRDLGDFSASAYGTGRALSPVALPAPVTQRRHPHAQGRVPWLVTLGRASLTGLPGAAKQEHWQEHQPLSTTAHNTLKTKTRGHELKKKKKRDKTNWGRGNCRSASPLVSQGCPLSHFTGKVSWFP